MSKQVKNKIKKQDELSVANRKIALQIKEKEKRAAELIIANKELAFQNKEKEKRTAELIIANNEFNKTEEELKEKEFFLRESQRAGNIGSYKTNFVTGTWQSSETLDRIFGIDKNYHRTIAGWLDIVHPDDRQNMDEYLHLEVIGKQKSFNREYRIKRINDKQTKWVCGMGDLKFDDRGNVTELIGTIQDITERKKAEELLFNSQQNYKKLLENMNDGFMVDDISGKVTFVNKRFLEIFGLTERDINNFLIEDYAAPDYAEILRDRHNHRIAGEKVPDVFVFEGLRKNGKKIWLEVRVNQIIKNEIITGTQSVISDITERKKAEDALSESENHLHTIVQAEPECVKLLSINNELLEMNPAGLAMIEADNLQQVKGKSILDIIDDPYRNAFKELNLNVFKGKPGKMEFEITGLKGTHRWFETHAVPLKDAGGKITSLLAVTRDITERKKAEEKIRESNERYEYVNKATQDTIWEWDYHTNQGKWGEGIMTTFGYSEDKLNYGETWLDEYVHPDDKESLSKNIHDRIEGSFQTCQNEYRFRCADGTYKYVFDRAYILFDENKKPYRMIGAMTDLTEKKRLERELAEQQIGQQKLITETIIRTQEKERNELGRELHDNINQILATVKMYLGMAKAKENVSVDLVGQSFEYVTEAMEEIRKLSHSLVAPSLGDIGLKEALLGLVEDANSQNLQVQLLFDEKFNEMDIDNNKELMFYRIVQEQMNNITKYAKAGKVVISFKTDDDILILSVADDGVGFDSEQKSKGIGLKNISSRVEFYSGNINIISAPGQGCTLEVFIPC